MAACSQADRRQPGDTGRDPCGATEIEDDAGECVPAACGRAATGDVSDADVILAPGDDVQAAVDALGSGTVALTAGTYDAQLSLGAEADGIHIAGRCPELVTIDGSKWTNGQPVIAIGENAPTFLNSPESPSPVDPPAGWSPGKVAFGWSIWCFRTMRWAG